MPHTPIILVGMKADLRNDQDTIDKLANKGIKVLTAEDGLALVKQVGAAKLVEISAVKGSGLKELCEAIVQVIMVPSKSRRTLLQSL